MFYDLKRMCGWVVLAGRFALTETRDTEVVVGAIIVGASDAYLGGHVSTQRTDHGSGQRGAAIHTVAVMSAEQISQMYLMPPSVVLTAVFFLMRPMVGHTRARARDVVRSGARR